MSLDYPTRRMVLDGIVTGCASLDKVSARSLDYAVCEDSAESALLHATREQIIQTEIEQQSWQFLRHKSGAA
jgi:uncharacterized protein YcfL